MRRPGSSWTGAGEGFAGAAAASGAAMKDLEIPTNSVRRVTW